jgi:hypothetical protein
MKKSKGAIRMFDKKTALLIAKINAREITGQSSPSDLQEALLLTVAAFRDYQHYEITLQNLGEDFDETVEYCDPATWFSWLDSEAGKPDTLTTRCAAGLDIASENFAKLAERAQKNCAAVLKAILSAPPAAQKTVLGRAYKIKAEAADAKIEELLNMLHETEYHQSMPDNLDAFLAFLCEQWGADEQRP